MLVEAVPRERCRRAQRRRPAGARHAPRAARARSSGSRCRAGRRNADDRRPLPPRRQGARAGADRAGDHDRRAPRSAPDAAGLHPPAAGDVRRQGRCSTCRTRMAAAGRRLRRRGAAARHPAGTAHVHHLLLPRAGPAQRGRRQRHQGDRRLLPQRPGDARCSATSSTGVGESLDSGSELGKPSRIGVVATAGDRRDEDMVELGEIAAQHFDVVDRPRGRAACAAASSGETAGLIADGVRRAHGRGRPLQAARGDPRRDRGGAPRAEPGQPRATSSWSASTSTRR